MVKYFESVQPLGYNRESWSRSQSADCIFISKYYYDNKGLISQLNSDRDKAVKQYFSNGHHLANQEPRTMKGSNILALAG